MSTLWTSLVGYTADFRHIAARMNSDLDWLRAESAMALTIFMSAIHGAWSLWLRVLKHAFREMVHFRREVVHLRNRQIGFLRPAGSALAPLHAQLQPTIRKSGIHLDEALTATTR